MKTTVLTFALALATMPLTFAAQAPAPAAPTAPKSAVAETAKTTKKHHKAKKAVKAAKTPASTTPAPVKQ